MLLIDKCNPKRYANLVNDIVNGYTHGQEGYPMTSAEALAYLNEYKSTQNQG